MTRTLDVYLPGNILYVSGTVNGESVTWTQAGDAWQAVAQRSSTEIYQVEITAVNALGTSASYSMTLYYGLHLVTIGRLPTLTAGRRSGQRAGRQ